MTGNGHMHLLVSNFRECMAILESLRASRRPGRGMRHFSARPVISAALRQSEVTEVTGGIEGEFPVLCIADSECLTGPDGAQADCVPLSRIRGFAFRTEQERDLVAGKMFENLSTDGVTLEVAPALFGDEGEPRFRADPGGGISAETAEWNRADAIAGAVAAVLSLLASRPDATAAARDFLRDDGVLPVRLGTLVGASVPDVGSSESSLGTAVAQVTFNLRGQTGQEPLEVLDCLVEALGAAGHDEASLGKFRSFVGDVVTARRARKANDLSDDGDVLLRSLLLLLQRDRADEILGDRADGAMPGVRVHLTAMALAGFREGLARMPTVLKHSLRGPLGNFAAALENEPLSSPLPLVGAFLDALPGLGDVPDRGTSAAANDQPPQGRGEAGPITDLAIAELTAVANACGLSVGQHENGKLGTCTETGITATASVRQTGGGATATGEPLVSVVIGQVTDTPLVREALAGALLARPGSTLWLPPGEEEFELVFRLDASVPAEAGAALRAHIELARRWHAAAAAARTSKDPVDEGKPSDPATAPKAARKPRKASAPRRKKKTTEGDASLPAPPQTAESADKEPSARSAEALIAAVQDGAPSHRAAEDGPVKEKAEAPDTVAPTSPPSSPNAS